MLILGSLLVVATILPIRWTIREQARILMRARVISAIKDNDSELAEKLLREGADMSRVRLSAPSLRIQKWLALLGRESVTPAFGDEAVAVLMRNSVDRFLSTNHNEATGLLSALLESGANAKAPDEDGSTPLRLASWCGDVPAVRLLLAYGADPNQADKMFGTTPLMVARSEATAHVLLVHGANPNATDSYGETPLMFAAHDARPGVITALQGAGADAHAVDLSGLSLLDYDRDHILGPELRLLSTQAKNSGRSHTTYRNNSERRHAAFDSPKK